MSDTADLRSTQFRREREGTWREFDSLVTRFESSGQRGLNGDELARLPILYRAALSSLSVARAISLDRNLLGYLENLAARGYLASTARKRRCGGRWARSSPIAFAMPCTPRVGTSWRRRWCLRSA